jgi:hypothetical protein
MEGNSLRIMNSFRKFDLPKTRMIHEGIGGDPAVTAKYISLFLLVSLRNDI